MSTRARRYLSPLFVLTLIIVGCVTINLYFPEQDVKDLAGQIEAQVEAQAETENPPAENPGTPEGTVPDSVESTPHPEVAIRSSGATGLFDLLLGVTPAYAQSVPEPELTNPAILKMIDSRAARLPVVNQFKSSGVIGENNEGDLEIRDLAALSDLRARAEVQKLVRAENADREQLYKEIAGAKNIDPSQLGRIRETYAETLRANARVGDWIQMPDGGWAQKR